MQSGICQKPLSKTAIVDFATQCGWLYRNGSDYFKATINTILGTTHRLSDVAIIMENLSSDIKGREELFAGLYDRFVGSDDEYLFQQLYSLGITAIHSRELADYIKLKYDKERKFQEIKEKKEVEKYNADYADEIRKADSLQKIKEDEERRIMREKEEAKKKELFLNEQPRISEVSGLFSRPRQEVINYLTNHGYVFIDKRQDADRYKKSGQLNDTMSVFITFKNERLQIFSFTSKADWDSQRNIEDSLAAMDFIGTNGTVLHEGSKEVGTYRSLKNSQEKIKCELWAHSYSRRYWLTITFSRYKFSLM